MYIKICFNVRISHDEECADLLMSSFYSSKVMLFLQYGDLFINTNNIGNDSKNIWPFQSQDLNELIRHL